MPFPSFEGRSFGTTDRVSFRPLRVAMGDAGVYPSCIGAYQIAILDAPYSFTRGHGKTLCKSSRHWLLAYAPHVFESGNVYGRFNQYPLYIESESECPGDWPHWQWDGNVEKPTLTPSIGSPRMNEGIGYHGYLRNGNWIGC